MNIVIRPVRIEDSGDINELRRMKGVMENTLAMASERVSRTKKFTENLSNDDYVLVAEVEEENIKKVVGLVGLHLNTSPRLRHSASIGISVHTQYQSKGIGRKLLNEILDIADNWLMLVRIELGVYCDNEKAIDLYKSLGFEIEGIKKHSAIRNGKYVNEYIMARYNINELI